MQTLSGADETVTANFALDDTTAPTLLSFTRQTPSTENTGDNTLVFRAIFDEDMANVDATDFAANGTTATVTGVSPVTGTSVYDITVDGGDLINLDGVVGLDLASGQDIEDLGANALADIEPTTDET